MNDKKILGLIKVIIYALLMNLLPVQDTEQATETLGKIFLEEIRDGKLLFEYRIAVFDSKELINRKIVTEAETEAFSEELERILRPLVKEKIGDTITEKQIQTLKYSFKQLGEKFNSSFSSDSRTKVRGAVAWTMGPCALVEENVNFPLKRNLKPDSVRKIKEIRLKFKDKYNQLFDPLLTELDSSGLPSGKTIKRIEIEREKIFNEYDALGLNELDFELKTKFIEFRGKRAILWKYL